MTPTLRALACLAARLPAQPSDEFVTWARDIVDEVELDDVPPTLRTPQTPTQAAYSVLCARVSRA